MNPTKFVVITGANAGIGEATAKALATLGYSIISVCRRPSEGQRLVAELKALNPSIQVENFTADLSDLNSVRKAAEEILDRYPVIDRLINNAGYYSQQVEYVDGVEKSFLASHLGHMLLTLLLLPALKRSSEARIVTVSSMLHGKGKYKRLFAQPKSYSGSDAYNDGKLANAMFTIALAKTLPDNVTTYSLHPGVVNSNFAKNSTGGFLGVFFFLLRRFFISPEKGAATSVYLTTEDIQNLKPLSGNYFEKKKATPTNNKDITQKNVQELWDKSIAYLKPYVR